uniref:Uncharacterized protein n=1 Tax=Ditylenchus dipsaci TaxID=166011 RepID=A0A915CTF9_9BILA
MAFNFLLIIYAKIVTFCVLLGNILPKNIEPIIRKPRQTQVSSSFPEWKLKLAFREILATYQQKLLFSSHVPQWNEGKHGQRIILTDVSLAFFRQILVYIYTARLILSQMIWKALKHLWAWPTNMSLHPCSHNCPTIWL